MKPRLIAIDSGHIIAPCVRLLSQSRRRNLPGVSSRLRVQVSPPGTHASLPPVGSVFLGLFEVAVELFDEIGNLLRIALFSRKYGEVFPLFTRVAGHTTPFLAAALHLTPCSQKALILREKRRF